MSALTILLIRHAEKPTPENGQPGLTCKGDPDPHSLIVRGWQRAGAWAALFGSGLRFEDFPKPDVVYAADPDRQPVPDGLVSRRPFQTVVPLCERLHVAPVTTHGVDDEQALVDEVRQLTGVALICWEHKRIAKAILPDLVWGQKLPQLPSKWDGSRFDVVLRFDRAQSGAPWSFRQLFPRLLGGDLDTPLGFGEE